MHCMLLGGTGFLGKHLCELLIKNSFKVSVYAHRLEALQSMKKIFPNIGIIQGEFLTEENFAAILEGVDVVFHLISTTNVSNEDVRWDVQSNILPTVNLLEACIKNEIQRFIFFSSGGTVYGMPAYLPIDEKHPLKPICSYGMQKVLIENYIQYYGRVHGLRFHIMRLSNPYGAWQDPLRNQGAIAVFLACAMRGQPIQIWGDGSITRDYIYIEDAMEACLKLLVYRGEKTIFNIGCGKGTSLKEIIIAIEDIVETPVRIQYFNGRSQDVSANILDIFDAQQALAWHPRTDLKRGIQFIKNTWDKEPKDRFTRRSLR